MKIRSSDNLIAEGISYASYTCKEIKVHCNDCEYNDYLTCKKFDEKKVVDFTGDEKEEYAYKKDLNPDGKCKHFKPNEPKVNFFNKLIKKLWEK